MQPRSPRSLVNLVLLLLLAALIYAVSTRFMAPTALSQQQQLKPTKNRANDVPSQQQQQLKANPTEKTVVASFYRKCGYAAVHRQEQVQKICQREQTPQLPVCLAIRVEHLDQRDFRQAALALPSGSKLRIFVHPIKDAISNFIVNSGGWDPRGVNKILRALAALPSAAFVDIGCNLGVFSLRAAHLGRPVVSIDANYENVIRLRKSILANGLHRQSEIYWNALSTEPGTLKMRLPGDCNVGGGMPMRDQQQSEWLKGPIEVRTVGLDSILLGSQVLKDTDELVIKIDIEGYEWVAMTTAEQAFRRFKVAAVLMEWRGTQIFHPNKAAVLLEFLKARNFSAISLDKPPALLNSSAHSSWPPDVIWVRRDYWKLANIL